MRGSVGHSSSGSENNSAVILPPVAGGTADGRRNIHLGDVSANGLASDGMQQQPIKAVATLAATDQPLQCAAGQLSQDSGIGMGVAAGRPTVTGFTTGRGSDVRVSKAAADRMTKLFAGEEDLFGTLDPTHGAAEAGPQPGGQRGDRPAVQRSDSDADARRIQGAEQLVPVCVDATRNADTTSPFQGQLSPCPYHSGHMVT